MKRLVVILNETHSLMPDQERVILEAFPGFAIEKLSVPSAGWTLPQIKKQVEVVIGDAVVIFASPIPAMILLLAGSRAGVGVHVLHNDRRIAKEIRNPDGSVRIIHTVSPEGWEIV